MNNKKLIVLSIVAVGMIIWAVAQSRVSSKITSNSEKSAYLIQGLDPADISSIVLGRKKDIVTLKQQRNHFVVSNKDDYPAQLGQINDMITRLLDIKTIELITSNVANH